MVVPLALGLAEGLGHGAVGQKHEVFDKLMTLVLHTHVGVDGFLVLVKDELHLFRVEVDAAHGHALLAQFCRQLVEGQNFGLVITFATLNHSLHLFVGIAAARFDDGLANPAIVNLGLVIHLEND